MKFRLLLILLFSVAALHGQSLPDSIMLRYNQAQTNYGKGKVLISYVRKVMQGTATDKMSVLIKQFDYFTKQGDVIGSNYVTLCMGIVSWRTGEYATASKYIIPSLQYFEKVHDTLGIIRSLDALGSSFSNAKNYEQSLAYWKRAMPMAKKFHDKEAFSSILNNTADCYLRMELSDSALLYIQDAVALGRQERDTSSLSYSVGTMGEIYMLRNEHDVARPFLKQSIAYSKMKIDRFGTSYGLNSISQSFFKTDEYDSSITYAQEALYYAQPDYKAVMMTSYEWLYKNYEKKNLRDSVYKYFRLAMSTKDSLFTIEKNRSLQFVNFQELVRLQEQEAEKIRIEEDRKANVQFTLIALGIVCLLILYLLLSRSFITNVKWIKFFGVVGLLLVFEFLNLLLHPFLEKITGHSLILMLLALVCIAGLLVPMHHKLEKWAISKIVEKNKQIRLAAARKTIKQLDDDV